MPQVNTSLVTVKSSAELVTGVRIPDHHTIHPLQSSEIAENENDNGITAFNADATSRFRDEPFTESAQLSSHQIESRSGTNFVGNVMIDDQEPATSTGGDGKSTELTKVRAELLTSSTNTLPETSSSVLSPMNVSGTESHLLSSPESPISITTNMTSSFSSTTSVQRTSSQTSDVYTGGRTSTAKLLTTSEGTTTSYVSTTANSSTPQSFQDIQPSTSSQKAKISVSIYDADDTTTSGLSGIPGYETASINTTAIVLPIVIGLAAAAVAGLIAFFLYRRQIRHRKKNIIKYKRYSQNGEISVPLTAVPNDNYRFTRVSAHEEAMVYSQVEKTIRPPRPTYRYKKEENVPLKQDIEETEDQWGPLPKHVNNNSDDMDTVLVDNATYDSSPTRVEPPKVPVRKSNSDSHGSLKKTPGTTKKDISWPIPKGNSIVGDTAANGGLRGPYQTVSSTPPPLPPSPRHGPPSGRPIAPSPRCVPRTPPSSRPTPPTPPSPDRRLPPPPPPSRGHVYDAVYVPSSDADAINRRLDNAGYVTSRRMRMHGLDSQPYEDVEVYSDLASGSQPSAASPTRSQSDTSGPGSPSSACTANESKSGSDAHEIGDRSFDTNITDNSNKVHFSMEDITKVIDNSFGAQDGENEHPPEAEYSDIAGDYDQNDSSIINANQSGDVSDDEKDSAYEAVNFK